MAQPTQLKDYTLPEHLQTRPLTLDDAEAAAKLLEIAGKAMGDETTVINPEQLRKEWEDPQFSLEDSTLAVFSSG